MGKFLDRNSEQWDRYEFRSHLRMVVYKPMIRNIVSARPAPRIRLLEITGADIAMGFVGSGVGVSGRGVMVGGNVKVGVLLG